MDDLIVIGGAPGVGKSSVSALLQQMLDSPLIEFGWLPEFRFTGIERIGPDEEEEIAFENLCLITKNYLRHGFRRIILADLNQTQIRRLPVVFAGVDYALFTLRSGDGAQLRARVLDESRSSGYRDWRTALAIDAALYEREASDRERFIDIGARSAHDVAVEIASLLSV